MKAVCTLVNCKFGNFLWLLVHLFEFSGFAQGLFATAMSVTFHVTPKLIILICAMKCC